MDSVFYFPNRDRYGQAYCKDIHIKKDLLAPLLAFKLISFTEIEASVLAGVPVIRHGPWPPIKELLGHQSRSH